MAYRFFPSKNVEWLEAKLNDVNEQLAAGKMATAANAGDQGGSFARETNLRAVQQQIIWDLAKLVPDAGWEAHLLPTTLRGVISPGRSDQSGF